MRKQRYDQYKRSSTINSCIQPKEYRATYQRDMTIIFKKILGDTVEGYVDVRVGK